MEKKIYIGAAYYPEQWAKERWEIDSRLMGEAGINVVRLAEFGWSLMEPQDGIFDFSLFDEAIEVLRKNGVQAVLGTPTMAPPMWMCKKYPDIVITNIDGLKQGRRSAYCPNNPNYINYTKRFVRKMAEHYKDNLSVLGWQIDNEFNGNPCYCKDCEKKFREWLQIKYKTLDNLNEAWGTVFWSQVYNSWDEVSVPSKSEMITTVSQKLDFKRFTSDSKIEFEKIQTTIIHDVCPNQAITHNGMGLYDRIDYYKLAQPLDFYSFDTYPAVDGNNMDLCLAHDLSRGIKQKNYWVMEQKNGYFNYSPYNLAIEPGLVRLWSYRDIARGADGVVYFRWRSGRFGSEQHPQGLLRQDGSKRRAFYEAQKLSNEMKNVGSEIAESKFQSEAAMLWSYDQIWALEDHIQNEKFSYKGLFKEYYNAISKLGVNVDVINPMADLSKYKIVIAPSLFVLNEEIADNLKEYVKNGGILILTIRTGVRTWSSTTVDTPWPGLLYDITGADVVEFDSLPSYASNKVLYNGKSYKVDTFLEILECKNAKPLATYEEKFYQGESAITINNYGKGQVIYCGIMGNTELIQDLLKTKFTEKSIKTFNWPEGIEVTYRRSENKTFMFVINGEFEDKEITLDKKYFDVLTDTLFEGKVTLKKLDVMILTTF